MKTFKISITLKIKLNVEENVIIRLCKSKRNMKRSEHGDTPSVEEAFQQILPSLFHNKKMAQ